MGIQQNFLSDLIKNKKQKIWIFCFLVLLLSIAFYDVVFLGKTFKVTTSNAQALMTGVYGQSDNKPKFIPVVGTDAPVLEEPIYEFIRQNLRQGILPLWNPHQACGHPLVGMIQIGLFYPLNLILYLLPSLYSWDILILLRLLLAGFFTYWFMRVLNFKNFPAMTSAIVFMIGGPMTLIQYWTANVDILTPLLLIALDRLIRHPKAHNISILAFCVALTVLGGHPEHILLVNTFGLAFFIFRLCSLRNMTDYKKVLFYYFVSCLLGLGLSAIALFPFLRGMLVDLWHAHPHGVGQLMEEQREKALTLALPHFFQKETLISYKWVMAGWWGGYLGIIPLALSFLSLLKKQKGGMNYFFFISAFLIIGKEYGLPVINWIGALPLFNLVRYAIHSPPLAGFCVAVLTGMGVRIVVSTKKLFMKALLFNVCLLIIIGSHLIVLESKNKLPDTAIEASCFALGIMLIFQLIIYMKDKNFLSKRRLGLILFIAVFTELFLYIHRERPRRFDSFAKVPYLELLKSSTERVRSYGIFWAFYPNTATGFGVDDLGYFSGLVPKRFVKFSNYLIAEDHMQQNLRPPGLRTIPIPSLAEKPGRIRYSDRKQILDLLNIRYFISPPNNELSRLIEDYDLPIANFDPAQLPDNTVYSKEVNVYARPSALPRAFIVHRAVFNTDEQATLSILDRLGTQIGDVAVINHQPIPLIVSALENTPVKDNSEVSIIKYTPNEVKAIAKLENPGFLVLSDAYHPDWKVFVNEKPWKLFQTDYLIRSVYLPKGFHEVKFVFKPFYFYLGALVSGITVFPFLILLWKKD